jgi:hypothetical protein
MEVFAIAFLAGQLGLLSFAIVLNRAATRNWAASKERNQPWRYADIMSKSGVVTTSRKLTAIESPIKKAA